MRENVGRIDRFVRSILGPTLITRGIWRLRRHPFTGLLGIIAGTMITETAVTRVCPLSGALGIDTRSTSERMSDFRGDVNEQTERIASEYAKPLEVEEASPARLA